MLRERFIGHILTKLTKSIYNLVRQTKCKDKEGKMIQVNMLEAKTDFSKLIKLLETKKEDYITIARNGKPIAKITLLDEAPVSKRIGVAKGKFKIKGDFDADNLEIAESLFGGRL